ncbi:MAG: hypothetical protein HDR53_08030 [Treponema sp.]|nr:hypothetical protein [Treponema sp.]
MKLKKMSIEFAEIFDNKQKKGDGFLQGDSETCFAKENNSVCKAYTLFNSYNE